MESRGNLSDDQQIS